MCVRAKQNKMDKKTETERQHHFVLVHGACHGAWCWYKVASLLQSSGHRVTALDLAASGVNPKQLKDVNSMLDYVEPLLDFLGSLPPSAKVMLVGHSMGGAAVSMAMERFPEKIKVAFFASAVMVGPQLSYVTASAEYNRRLDSNMDSRFGFDGESNGLPTSVTFGFNFMSSKLYQLSPPEDLMLASYLLRPVRLFPDESLLLEQTSVTEERFGSVRRVYIVCDSDKVMNEDLQRWMIEKTPPDEVKVIAGSDHMVMFSKPLELSASILEISDNCS